MKSLLRLVGRVGFWAAWPLLYVYLGHGERTRVLLRCGERVLVVKTWLGNGRWILPGGGLHRGEEPAVGVLRELKEETGIELQAEQLVYKGLHKAESNGLRFKYHMFIGDVDECLPVRAQVHEISDVEWIAYDTIVEQRSATASSPSILQTWFKS